MPTILLCLNDESVTPELRDGLAALLPTYKVIISRDEATMRAHAADIELAAGWVPAAAAGHMPNLRWVQMWSAGVDPYLAESRFLAGRYVVTNGSGIHSVNISEQIFAYLLGFARSFPCAMRAQRQATWLSYPDACRKEVFELDGATMLLIGVGAIGARTAQLAKAFGMHVIGVRRDPTKAVDGVDEMVGQQALDSVLPQADAVVITAPSTPETHHMIDAARLHLMKSTSILVNIGRGAVIDESALITALREGWIGGAGLDVFETEPLPGDSPLWGMDNVIITSHYAGHTPRYDERATALFLDNLKRWLDGQSLRNVVDPERGY